MLSPFSTHVLLLISSVVFSWSLVSFILRLTITKELLILHEDSFRFHPRFEFEDIDHSAADRLFVQSAPHVSSNQSLTVDNASSTRKTDPSVLDRFTFVNSPRPTCIYPRNAAAFLIIVVLSRATNFDYRQAIRATWGRNGKYKRSPIHVQTIFFVGTDDSVQSAVRNEQIMFNDVIEIGIPENYPFVAHKELASLYWTRLYCPLARFVFRADDDIFLDTFLLLNYIEHQLNLRERDGLYGWFRFNNTVHRADKWSVTKQEYPSTTYPAYTFGIGYLFSNQSCQHLLDAANHPQHQVIRIGDAYITGILRELAHLPYYDFIDLEYAYTFFQPIACDDHFERQPHLLICMSKLHVGIRDDPYEFYDVWDVILVRHNLSSWDL